MTQRRWLTQILLPCVLLILAATAIRLPGLGKWCLSEDEFYIGETAERIQATGVPLLKSGDVYTRGIGLTYLTAAVAEHFGSPEFALRLPALVAGVLTVAVFFVLCRLFLPTGAVADVQRDPGLFVLAHRVLAVWALSTPPSNWCSSASWSACSTAITGTEASSRS